MGMSGVTQGREDREERTDGGKSSEQDGSGTERLAARDIEAGSGQIGGKWLARGWMALWLSQGRPGWRRSGGVGHTDSVDAVPKVP